MNGTIVTKDALEVIQNNIMMINPWFYSKNAEIVSDDNYKEMVRRIWKLLESHYGHKDKVLFYTKRLKQFKQKNLTTMQYISKFKTYLNELKLEINVRNEMKLIHIELTTYEYARILMAARPEVMEFVAKQAIDLDENDVNEAPIDLETALSLFNKYSKIERLKQNALFYTDNEKDKDKQKSLFTLNSDFNFDNVDKRKPYCFSTKARCRNKI